MRSNNTELQHDQRQKNNNERSRHIHLEAWQREADIASPLVCEPYILRHDSDQSSRGVTSGKGQKRRFDPMPATSGLPRTTDVIRPARLVRFVPGAETFTALRKAAARSAETICVTIGEILRALTPTECANYFRNSGYAQS